MDKSSAISFLPVRINTLNPTIEVTFDLYVKLPHKYLLYARSGDYVEQERLMSLKSKKVRKLFIDDKDEENYQSYLDHCLSKTMENESITTEEKAEMVVDVASQGADEVFERPVEEKSYKSAQRTSEILMSVISQNDELLAKIVTHKNTEDSDYDARMRKHSINVSSLVLGFAEYLGLPAETKSSMGIAGLYHDISYTEFPADKKYLFFTPMEKMDSEDLVLYRSHPQLSHDLLRDKEFVNKEVLNLVLTHEERLGGQGFPNKVTKFDAHQEVFVICCAYDYRLTCLDENLPDIIKNMAIDEVGKFDLEMIQNFKKFLKTFYFK